MKLSILILLLFVESAFASVEKSSADSPATQVCEAQMQIGDLDKLATELGRNFAIEYIQTTLGVSSAKFDLKDFALVSKLFGEFKVKVSLEEVREDRDKTEVKIALTGRGESIALGLRALERSAQQNAFGKTLVVSDQWLRPLIYPAISQEILTTKITDMDVSLRTYNALKNAEILLLGDLIQVESEAQLLRIPNFGRRSLEEVRELLQRRGLQLNTKIKDWPQR